MEASDLALVLFLVGSIVFVGAMIALAVQRANATPVTIRIALKASRRVTQIVPIGKMIIPTQVTGYFFVDAAGKELRVTEKVYNKYEIGDEVVLRPNGTEASAPRG